MNIDQGAVEIEEDRFEFASQGTTSGRQLT
jgi:hypothetical protein